MKYQVVESVVWVLGRLWMPPVEAALTMKLDDSQVNNAIDRASGRRPARQDLEEWLNLHCGDFQEVIDFSASLEIGDETVNFEWKDEDNEIKFNECLFHDEN